MLNIYPYNNGHLMVAPLRHVKDFSRLSDGELLDLMRSVEKARSLLASAIKPEGYNIGVNMSAVAGAGIPGHLHVHIVPRWKGDTNFMPVIGQTKIISQSLEQLLKLLKNAHAGTHKRIRK
jgi:ATP adenylyltransferase